MRIERRTFNKLALAAAADLCLHRVRAGANP